MKISEITTENLIAYCKEELDDVLVIKEFEILLTGAKAYLRGQTGLTDAQMDEKEDLTIALMVLVNDMHENRVMSVEKSSVNKIVESIISMHSVNLL